MSRLLPWKTTAAVTSAYLAQEPADATQALRAMLAAMSPEQLRETLLGALGGGAA